MLFVSGGTHPGLNLEQSYEFSWNLAPMQCQYSIKDDSGNICIGARLEENS